MTLPANNREGKSPWEEYGTAASLLTGLNSSLCSSGQRQHLGGRLTALSTDLYMMTRSYSVVIAWFDCEMKLKSVVEKSQQFLHIRTQLGLVLILKTGQPVLMCTDSMMSVSVEVSGREQT